eukprot:CAMPEP_0194038192 /NCGR_PEP_ID=MMETSP0009_2-20130614/10459_1 /TAXON_ID=210454 /ORGANISM="Grammatophora oceanica, Strain CCMP 410" /LENGTH=50 /DNA_ID=CAMNT_0038680615 /DNA_START=186 /DNA_END=335 /DNA_ORIENTATION=-
MVSRFSFENHVETNGGQPVSLTQRLDPDRGDSGEEMTHRKANKAHNAQPM